MLFNAILISCLLPSASRAIKDSKLYLRALSYSAIKVCDSAKEFRSNFISMRLLCLLAIWRTFKATSIASSNLSNLLNCPALILPAFTIRLESPI